MLINDIKEQDVLKIKMPPFFTLQCDESSADISNFSQLLLVVCFLDDENIIKEEPSISPELATTSTSIGVMNIITGYFQKYDIKYEKLAPVSVRMELQSDVNIKFLFNDVNRNRGIR